MRALRTYVLLFVVFGVPFGLVMSVITGGLAGGLLAGAVGGALFALILGTMSLISSRNLPPGRSNSPRQSVTVPVRPGWDLAARIQGALASLPAELLAVDVPAGRYAARTKVTWRSWGEDVGVQLVGHPASPSAVITSRPVVRTTLIDMGRSRRNVDHIITALQH